MSSYCHCHRINFFIHIKTFKMYTHNEKVDMLLIYGECQKNSRIARELYGARYPERVLPDKKMFPRLERLLRNNTDVFSKKGTPVPGRALNEDSVAAVIEYFEANPRNSIRQASRELNITYSTIQRILKINGYHDYKLHNLEKLSVFHKERRMNFIAQITEVIYILDHRIFAHILWTDESRFVSNGKPNRKNEHYWANENPHFVNEIENQGHFGINVWCGMVGRHLVGPYFFENILDGRRYLQFLQEELPGLLEDIPLQLRLNLWYHHDGAPPHRVRPVQQFLNNVYGERWIGTNGPILWPPKSPDLTPLDFYLWGTLKNEVYKTASRDINHLKEKIQIACRNISRNVLARVTEIRVRRNLEKCLEVEGGHIENFE